ncbi:MAG: hypothetical protein ACFB4I_06105 [Cyanophyceae cyanobacterium]
MNIKTVAMAVGIIGGFYGLIAGFVGGTIGALVLSEASGFGGILYGLLALAAPIVGLVGAGMVNKKPLFGSSLMAIGGIGMFLVHIFGIFPALFFLAGAILGVIGKYQS